MKKENIQIIEWLPIESAPLNQTVLVWDRGDIYPAHYSVGFQRWQSAFCIDSIPQPSNWIKYPNAPMVECEECEGQGQIAYAVNCPEFTPCVNCNGTGKVSPESKL